MSIYLHPRRGLRTLRRLLCATLAALSLTAMIPSAAAAGDLAQILVAVGALVGLPHRLCLGNEGFAQPLPVLTDHIQIGALVHQPVRTRQ